MSNICWHYLLFCIFGLLLTDIKVVRVFGVLGHFLLSEKLIKGSVFNFVWKIKWSPLTHFNCWLSFSESTLSEKIVHKWRKLFTKGWEDVNDDTRTERHSTTTTVENIETAKKIIMKNRSISFREVFEDGDVSQWVSSKQLFRMFWTWNVWQWSMFCNYLMMTKKTVRRASLRSFEWRQI